MDIVKKNVMHQTKYNKINKEKINKTSWVYIMWGNIICWTTAKGYIFRKVTFRSTKIEVGLIDKIHLKEWEESRKWLNHR